MGAAAPSAEGQQRDGGGSEGESDEDDSSFDPDEVRFKNRRFGELDEVGWCNECKV